jgi:hypothetical protein
MVRLTAVFAALLVALGVALYLATGRESVTALIPAFVGLAFAACAWIARSERARPHAMHAATVLALIGLAGSARGVGSLLKHLGGTAIDRVPAAWGQSAMAVLCLVYIGFSVRSFVRARRARAATSP